MVVATVRGTRITLSHARGLPLDVPAVSSTAITTDAVVAGGVLVACGGVVVETDAEKVHISPMVRYEPATDGKWELTNVSKEPSLARIEM